jgi:hypothetical protein
MYAFDALCLICSLMHLVQHEQSLAHQSPIIFLGGGFQCEIVLLLHQNNPQLFGKRSFNGHHLHQGRNI